MVISRIAELQIGRHMFGVDTCKIFFEKGHAQTTPSMLVPRAQEAQVVIEAQLVGGLDQNGLGVLRLRTPEPPRAR